jgi:hypothetical protein
LLLLLFIVLCCARVTEASNITELGDFGHLEVLKHPEGLAQLGTVLARMLGLGDSSSSNSSSSSGVGEVDGQGAANATAADAAVGGVIEIANRTADMIEVTTSDDVIEVVGGTARPKPFSANAPWQGLAGLQQQVPGYVGTAALPGTAGQAAQQQQQQQQTQPGTSSAAAATVLQQDVQAGQETGQNSTV